MRGQHTDLGRRPGDSVLVGIHAVHDELSATADIVDRILEDLGISSGLDNDVKTVRVLRLELLELSLRVGARESNVFVTSTELLGQVHLQTLRRGDDNAATAILAQHLSKHLYGWVNIE